MGARRCSGPEGMIPAQSYPHVARLLPAGNRGSGQIFDDIAASTAAPLPHATATATVTVTAIATATASCCLLRPRQQLHLNNTIIGSVNMSSRLSIWGACRPLALRSRPHTHLQQPSVAALARHYSENTTPPPQPPFAPSNMPPARGSTIPNIPDSMLRPSERPPIREEDVQMRDLTERETAIQQLEMAAHGLDPFKFTGYKFEEPPMPQDKLPLAKYHMRHRYEEGISQFTRLLMRDGKLSKAQRVGFLPAPPPFSKPP